MKQPTPKRRSIPGWEGLYSADADGNIWSEARTVECKDRRKLFIGERKLKPGKKILKDYLIVALWRNNKQTIRSVHRLVAAAFDIIKLNDSTQCVDHINHDPSDNRVENLRLANKSQNAAYGGGKLPANNKSGYRGVFWNNQVIKWTARIRVSGKDKHCGHFDCPIEAAHSYDAAARKYFGEFAFQNFPRKEAA